MEPKNSPNGKGKSSEPNLHDFGFKMLVFRSVVGFSSRIIRSPPKTESATAANIFQAALTNAQSVGQQRQVLKVKRFAGEILQIVLTIHTYIYIYLYLCIIYIYIST